MVSDAGRRVLDALPLPGDSAISAAAEITGKQQYYRWRGEDGVWHFSDEPPPEGTKAEIFDLPEPATAAAPSSAVGTTTGTALPMDSTIAPAMSLPEGVSREAIEQMLEATHQRRMGEEL
jgi:hypothetical protein